MDNKKGNMTEGSPFRLIFAFALPMIMSNIVQQLYSMADSAIVGRFVGKEALAAVGATSSVLMLMICIIVGFTMGTCICTSQAYGAGNEKLVKDIAGTALFVAGMIGCIIFVLGIVIAVPVLRFLNTPEEIIPFARTYLLFNTCTCFAPIYYNLFANIMRALGDSKSSLYAVICSSVMNVILDLLFVCVFHWGVAGAAVATAISQAASALVCLVIIRKNHAVLHLKQENLRIQGKIVKRILSIGVPMAIQNGVTSIGSMGVQSFVNSYGTDTVAAFAAAGKIDQIALMPLNSMGMAVSTFVGQNFGAGKMDRIKQGLRAGIVQAFGWGLVLMTVIKLFGGPLITLFVSAQETHVIEVGKEYLGIVSMFYWGCGIMYVLLNTFRGMGRMTLSTIASCLDPLGRMAFAFILSTYVAGRTGLWMAWPCGWLLASLPTAAVLLFGNALKKED